MNVNYLIEINALDDWELTHPLSPTAYKLMRKLLYLANKERFPRTISVPNATLIHMVNCSEDSLARARNSLIQEGLIVYKGQKRVRPQYEIQYFTYQRAKQNPQYADIPGDNPQFAGTPTGFPTGISAGFTTGFPTGFPADIDINKIKRNTNGEEDLANENGEEDARAMRGVLAFLTGLRATPYANLFANAASMRQVMQTSRFPAELIGEALEMTLNRHMRYPLADGASYALQLLVDWTNRGIMTAEELRESRDNYYG